jgi:NADH-ubiquinone oxidoreductase chain 5
MNHAFFKALLFLSAGSVIHAMADEQDMRKMGGLIKVIPITYIMILIGSLALMGFPFLTGFYSKDILLELTYGTYHISGLFAFWLGTLSAFFTAFYSIRLIFLTFIKPTSSSSFYISNAHESSTIMLIPLFILGFGSIFIGFLFKDLFLGLGVDTWNTSLFQLTTHISYFESEFLDFKIKLIPFIFSISGLILAICIYHIFEIKVSSLTLFKRIYSFYTFFIKKWYFDNIYNKFIVNTFFFIGYHISFKLLDRGLFELIGPLGIIRLISNLIKKISSLQSGLIYHYILIMILGLTFFFLLFIFPIYLQTSLLLVLAYTYVYLNMIEKKK